MNRYQVLLHEEAYQKAADYLHALQVEGRAAGAYLQAELAGGTWRDLDVPAFIERLLNSKRPRLFAESEAAGDGRDWNLAELSILGDIAFAVPVTVYDNGRHQAPLVHEVPFAATLLYVPGALLRNDSGQQAADWAEVTTNGAIDLAAFTHLYERRLVPALFYANDAARARQRQALITIPGLGCGLFAGQFQGQLGTVLREAIAALLGRYAPHLPHIRAVYYDPYNEAENERQEFGHLSYLVRPLTKGNDHKPQLCLPQTYAEDGDDFTGCHLFSFVAWDHVSWPGNDFYVLSRLTDDGVKAAATSSMTAITGVTGAYDERLTKYLPPEGYVDWLDVVRRQRCRLQARENLLVWGHVGAEMLLQTVVEG